MALRLSRGSCLAHDPFLPGEASEPPGLGQRVRPIRTALRPGKGRLRALLQAQRREQVTGDVALSWSWEAKPPLRVQAWPPTLGEAWGSHPPLSLGLRVPTAKPVG